MRKLKCIDTFWLTDKFELNKETRKRILVSTIQDQIEEIGKDFNDTDYVYSVLDGANQRAGWKHLVIYKI